MLKVRNPNGKILMMGRKAEGPGQLYKMQIAADGPDSAYAASLGKHTWEQFHRAMGHVNVAALKRLRLMADGIQINDSSNENFQCEPCILAKQHIKPYPKEATQIPENAQIRKW